MDLNYNKFKTIPINIEEFRLMLMEFEKLLEKMINLQTSEFTNIHMGKGSNLENIKEINTINKVLFLNPTIYNTIKYWEKNDKELEELEKRKIKIIENMIKGKIYLLDSGIKKINKELNIHVGEIYNKLKYSFNDYEYRYPFESENIRKEMWRTLPIISEQEKLLNLSEMLVKKRNNFAKKFYTNNDLNYINFVYELQDLNISEVKKTVDLFEETTRNEYFNLIKSNSINPWDIKSKFYLPKIKNEIFDFPKELIIEKALKFLHDNGVSKDLKPSFCFTNNKRPAGFLIINEIDSKIILSNELSGLNFIKVLFHELGHFLHISNVKQHSPLFKYETTVFSESMANIIERLGLSYNFLVDYLNIPVEDFIILKEKLKRINLYELRRIASDIYVKNEAYEGEFRNIENIKSKYEHKYLGLSKEFPPRWLVRELFGDTPEFKENKFLSEIIADYFITQFSNSGQISVTDLFTFLNKFFWSIGGAIEWKQKLRSSLENLDREHGILCHLTER